jgi:O-antigen/teichoic acid export membrane protein
MSFLRKGIIVSGGQVLAAVLTLSTSVLYARVLGPGGIGQYEYLRSTAAIVMTVCCMGMNSANIYFLNNRGSSAVAIATNTVKMTVILSAACGLGLTGTLLALPASFGHVAPLVAVLFSIGVGASVGTALLRSLLVARLEARRMVVVDVAPLFLWIGGGAVLAQIGRLSPQAAILVLGTGFLGAFALILRYVRADVDLRRPFDWVLFRSVLAYGVGLALINVLLVLTEQLGVQILGYSHRGAFENIGLYTRAAAVCSLVRFVPIALGPLMYAKWSGAQGAERVRQVEMAARMSAAYGLLFTIGVAFFGKYVILGLYGVSFLPAQAALRLLAPASLFIVVSAVYINVLASDGRARISCYTLVGAVIVLAAVTWLTVPRYGIRGAALGMLCGNAVIAFTSSAACYRFYGIHPLRCIVLRRSDLVYVRQALRGRRAGSAAAARDAF